MKAAIFDAPKAMHVGDWHTPVPGPDEVLVKVRAAGICAGDMYIFQGRNPYAKYPVIGGHEICGEVDGKLVVVEPFVGCGKCYPCRIGKSNCCANLKVLGVHSDGGYADYMVAPKRNIHPVPDGLSPMWASFAEPLAIGVQSCRRGALRGGEVMLILGAGPIGLALIEVAKAKGARPVVTDVLDARLEFARELGAEALKADDTLLQKVLDLTNGEGAPVVIEATGNAKAMESTVDLVAAGGRIVIVGLVKKGTMVSFPGLDFTRKEMTIVGSRASVNCFPEALELLASGKIRYPKVASEFSLWDAPNVFAKLDANPAAVHKGVLLT
ncbi:MAG TPA: zinc-binding alcohol dehydrogenase family protein [Verrucomicrobiae bacterium]|nr:zinc-binding alcohol dehydrogenase family protein [Verrucomicrobiae bacterium]